MTLIKPFRALRPAPGRAAEIIAPPYDVLSSDEARDRARARCIVGAGSARYWTRVKLEIARRQRIAIGLTGADMRA